MDCLQRGCTARVVSVGGETEFRRRLLEMGFCCGTVVEMIRRAPFGDPIEFRLRGYNLSLREEQARQVMVRLGVATDVPSAATLRRPRPHAA